MNSILTPNGRDENNCAQRELSEVKTRSGAFGVRTYSNLARLDATRPSRKKALKYGDASNKQSQGADGSGKGKVQWIPVELGGCVK
jgi:hypothetical protein